MTQQEIEAIRKRCKSAKEVGLTGSNVAITVFDAYTADIPALLDEVERLQKTIERYRNTEQWLDDMQNPLEPIKVQAALDSEIMKLNYRKERKPESISELDCTIIAALMFVQQSKEDI